MLTLNKLYSQLEELLQINADDSSFDRRLFYDLICQARAVDIRNEYNKLRTFNPVVIQSLNCVELEIVDASLCCSGLITGCNVLRTKQQLPELIEFHQQSAIRSIKPNSIFGKNINLVEADRIPYLKTKDGINDNMIYAFIFNNYLYLYSLNEKYLLIDSITVSGIFTDPVVAAEFGCSSGNCLTDHDSFPIAQWMWESTTRVKVLNNLSIKFRTKPDLTNNALDDQLDQQITNNKK